MGAEETVRKELLEAQVKQKRAVLQKNISKGWALYALLDKVGKTHTAKGRALYDVLKELEKQEAEMQLELAEYDVDKYLSDVGGIRVAD